MVVERFTGAQEVVMTKPRGQAEESIYNQQVQVYRRRFAYTMVHDRRDSRATTLFCLSLRSVDTPEAEDDAVGHPGPAEGEYPALSSVAAPVPETEIRLESRQREHSPLHGVAATVVRAESSFKDASDLEAGA